MSGNHNLENRFTSLVNHVAKNRRPDEEYIIRQEVIARVGGSADNSNVSYKRRIIIEDANDQEVAYTVPTKRSRLMVGLESTHQTIERVMAPTPVPQLPAPQPQQVVYQAPPPAPKPPTPQPAPAPQPEIRYVYLAPPPAPAAPPKPPTPQVEVRYVYIKQEPQSPTLSIPPLNHEQHPMFMVPPQPIKTETPPPPPPAAPMRMPSTIRTMTGEQVRLQEYTPRSAPTVPQTPATPAPAPAPAPKKLARMIYDMGVPSSSPRHTRGGVVYNAQPPK